MKEGGGGGEGRKRLQTNPSILKTCVRQRTQRLIGSASRTIACAASVSGPVRRESWEESKKKEWRGRGRRKKEPLARKPHDFEKLRSPTNAASDWCGASSVDCLALETSIKPGMLCLRASQIWSHLICGRRLQMLWTDIYLNRVCVKVYEIRVFKDWPVETRKGQFIGNDGLRIWLEKNKCTVCWR